MKQFKILRTKKNLFLELIENFGGYVVAIIILASIFSLFINVTSFGELFYRVGTRIMLNCMNYLFYVYIFECFKDMDDFIFRKAKVIYTIAVLLAMYYADSCYKIAGFSSSSIYGVLLGMFFGGIILFACLLWLVIVYNIAIFLHYVYRTAIKYIVYSKLPTTMAELAECGVRSRIDCLLYYLYMQKGFIRWKKHSVILLDDFEDEFGALTYIFYEFPLSSSDYDKLYDLCESSTDKEELLIILKYLAPEHAYSEPFNRLSYCNMEYYLRCLLNTQNIEHRKNEPLLLQMRECLNRQ